MTTIIHWLELYLSIQLVPITIKVVCLTPASAQFIVKHMYVRKLSVLSGGRWFDHS
jgi:heme oxygenase